MTYNKSEIMTNAWGFYKSGRCWNFSEALKLSWKKAKEIKIADLNVGDTINLEYGENDNFVTCTVKSVSDKPFINNKHVVEAVSPNGFEIEFVALLSDTVTLITKAVNNVITVDFTAPMAA